MSGKDDEKNLPKATLNTYIKEILENKVKISSEFTELIN